MSIGLIIPAVDLPRAPTPADEPATSPDGRGGHARPASAPHRRRAAATLIRQLCSRTDSALRRELDRVFAARPDLSPADRAAIARALSRFRNQLLHQPRCTLRAAASAPDPAGVHRLLHAVRHLLGLVDLPHAGPPGPGSLGDRPKTAPASSVA